MTPTAEQLAIINAATTSTANLLVNARAGAAKTTTIELIAQALPGVSTLAIAFNKKIAVALQERLPVHCTAMTLNSLGNKMWRDYTGKWMKVEPRKSFFILKELIDPLPADEKDEAYEILQEVLEGLRVAKSVGYLPAGVHPQAKPLMSREDFYNHALEFEPGPLHVELIEKVLRLSFQESFTSRIDFDDQIYMPALMTCSFSPYALTMVDEAQDLSPINHVLLKKVVKNKRLIAVGDPCQPLGTLITKVVKPGDRWNKPKLESVPIETIKEGDTVLGHNGNGAFMYNRKVLGITRKPFSGTLVVAGPTKYTPNHYCYTRFASLSEHWCVYLMQKGSAFRIGKARMSYSEQGLGPQIRAKAEGADALWILSTYETEQEAFIAEAVIQTEFGLSDLCFVDPARPWLPAFWEEMKTLNLKERALKCLERYHREFAYPLWQPGDSIPAKRPFLTRACNLLSGGELLPYRGEHRTGKESWRAFPIHYEPYDGDVISFTISDNRLYVADGIVTHNCQAIYGFRGASQNSMAELRELFSMKEFFLTICFRSAQQIVKNARWRAPDMAWRDGAPEGSIVKLSTWDASTILDGDAIICRNNAPLFSMALELLRAGRSPELLSGDILANLQSTLKKLGKPTASADTALAALDDWEAAQEKKRKDKGRVKDTAECIRIFLRQARTISDAAAALENICNRPGRIKLMTGHKSKGLEFDRVFFLDHFLLRRNKNQDANIEYVIATRAREALFYVDSAGWTGA